MHDDPSNPTASTYLSSKWQAPFIVKQTIHRPRCMKLLQRESYHSLIALVAPLGYGKTTLMSAWANALASKAMVGWLSLDAEDNDLQRFLFCLIHSLPLDPEIKNEWLTQLHSEPTAPHPQSMLETLLYQLNVLDEVHLFFDRYEVIHGDAIHRIMEDLITRSGSHVHVYIASRVNLPFYAAIQNQHPSPLTISYEHLKLNANEIKSFVYHQAKIKLPDHETNRLEQVTEGWLPAVSIYSSFLDGSRTTFMNELPAIEEIHPQVYELLMNSIFLKQSEELQRFMLLTSIPDCFNADLSFVLTETVQQQANIERLVRNNLFLFQEGNGQYRYHNLFIQCLRTRFKAWDKDGFQLMHTRCRTWFEQNGFILEAVQHALQLADYDRASELLLADIAKTFSYPKMSLIQLLEQFPHMEINQRPSIAMLYAWFLTAEHRITAAETVLHQAEVFMTDEDYLFPPTGEDLRGYIASIYSRVYFLRRNAEKGMAYMKETGERLNGPGYLYSHLNALDPCGSSLLKSNVGHWGAIDQSIAMCELAKAEWKGINKGYGIMVSLLGECYFERNQLKKAEKLLSDGRKIGLDLMDFGLLLPTSLTLIQLKQAIGEQQAAQILLEETGKLLVKHTQDALSVFHACQARMDMKAQNLTLTKKWLVNQPQATDGDFDKRYMYNYLTILRAYIYLHQYGKGIRLGEKLLQFCSTLYLQYYIAEIHLLLAVLYERRGDSRTSLRQIEHALEVSQEEVYIQLFLDAWDLTESIIKKCSKNTKLPKEIYCFAETLIQYNSERELYNDKLSFAQKKLSSKEYQVLQYLIEGKSNAFIADQMSITIETVKTHCKHIYQKLHLKTRKEVQKTFL